MTTVEKPIWEKEVREIPIKIKINEPEKIKQPIKIPEKISNYKE